MARVGRLAGAILLHTEEAIFLVGQPKVPCDWREAGVEAPNEDELRTRGFARLARTAEPRDVPLGPTHITMAVEGERAAELLASRLTIERSRSVSDRLWRLIVLGDRDEDDDDAPAVVDARWLGEVPQPIWQIVRDTVLRCT